MKIAIAILMFVVVSGCATQKRDLYPVPPTGWVLYCQDSPSDPGCADYTYLSNLNRYVNGYITYQPEPVGEEVWRVVPIGGAGDCEDYAMTKRATLLNAGWALDRLHLATCVMPDGESHVVLIAEVGQRWMVLDNATNEVRPFEDVPYRWLAVQFGQHWINYQFR